MIRSAWAPSIIALILVLADHFVTICDCSYGNMTLFYHGLNQTELALRHMSRALLLLGLSSGPDHPDVAATFINVAMMYQDIGKMDTALRLEAVALPVGISKGTTVRMFGPDESEGPLPATAFFAPRATLPRDGQWALGTVIKPLSSTIPGRCVEKRNVTRSGDTSFEVEPPSDKCPYRRVYPSSRAPARLRGLLDRELSPRIQLEGRRISSELIESGDRRDDRPEGRSSVPRAFAGSFSIFRPT
nr:clustered mitochondria protein-like [Ipomoea trifida]